MTSIPKRVQIEQAVARGESLDWIVEQLKVQPKHVDATLRHMERALAEEEKPRVGLARKGPKPADLLKPHGTHAAYNRHRNRGEVPCDECVEGESEYQSRRRARPRARRRRAA